mmetsp:Transcript_14024/g.24583  ORF Transcript_14024/g.24583 Transcript_14024/m.24583 type:complete len:80 (+) Transcript_14024:412-651(+)
MDLSRSMSFRYCPGPGPSNSNPPPVGLPAKRVSPLPKGSGAIRGILDPKTLRYDAGDEDTAFSKVLAAPDMLTCVSYTF